MSTGGVIAINVMLKQNPAINRTVPDASLL